MATDNKTDIMMIDQAFREIANMRQDFLPAVNGVVSSDLTTIKILNDLNEILMAKDAHDLSSVLRFDICSDTQREIGFAAGYHSTISIVKLSALLNRVADLYNNQMANMDKDELRRICRQQAQLILAQEHEKSDLQYCINEILDFTRSIALAARDKARLTARASKRRFETVANTLRTLMERRHGERERPEDVDVKKLQREYWGQPEKYYR